MNMAAWLFIKPLVQMQHPGLNLKLEKKESAGRKKTHNNPYGKPSDVGLTINANKCLQRKKERKQRSNSS